MSRHVRLILTTGVLALGAAGALWLSGADETGIGGRGLFDVYGWPVYLCVAGVLAVYTYALTRPRPAPEVMVAALLVLILLLHQAPVLIESAPRFQTAWTHVGFTDEVARTGLLETTYDARFSWPGFFAGAAALARVLGLPSSEPFILWFPPLVLAAYLVPLYVLGRALTGNWRATWLGLLLFVLFNWVGQDYFSPQGLAYLLALVAYAVLLATFRTCAAGPLASRLTRSVHRSRSRLLSSWRAATDRRAESDDLYSSAGGRVWLLLAVALVVLIIVPTHQLTPVLLGVGMAGLGIVGRLRPWPLVGLLAAAFAGWLGYMGQAYWLGHLEQIFGLVANPAAVFDQSVSERVSGTSDHLFVVGVRLRFALALGLLALAGLLWRWRRAGTVSLPLLVLAGTPAVMLAAGSYGGEGFLRAFFFALIGLVFLAAGLFFPDGARPTPLVSAGLFAVLVATVPVFVLSRWGNESFERVSAAELQITRVLYARGEPGSQVISFGDTGSLSYPGTFTFDFDPESSVVSLDDPPAAGPAEVESLLVNDDSTAYVVATASAVRSAVENLGYPTDWADRIGDRLLATGDYTTVYRSDAGFILRRQP